nr:hypothetical protein [Candidatus Njordarchaeum guaymaensis]
MGGPIRKFMVSVLLLLVLTMPASKSLSQEGSSDQAQKLIPVKSIMTNVVWALEGKVYFIVPDPNRMKTMNNPMAAYDTAAAGMVYSKTNATQNFGFDSDERWIETGLDNVLNRGKPKLTNKTIVLLGGRSVNYCVYYYEKASGITPIYFDVATDKDGTILYGFFTNTLYTQESKPVLLAYMTKQEDENYRNLFVIQSFTDNNQNKVYIMYGIGWKGTWAAGIYFKERYRDEISNLDKCCYIFRWVDLERDGYKDGYPQPDEIVMVYAYHYL